MRWFWTALAVLAVVAGAFWWRRTVAADERLICKLHQRWVSEETPIPS